MNPEMMEKEKGNQTAEKRTAIHDPQERLLKVGEDSINQLFKAYFNNKMTVLIFLIRAKQFKPDERLIETVCRFLDDLYRHMLAGGFQKRYRLTFLWLREFFQQLPDVSDNQRDRAMGFVRSLYDVFGIPLKENI